MATEMSASNSGEAGQASASQPPAGPAPLPTVEAEGLQPIYANFVKVTPAPEELVLDFGLNPNLPGSGAAQVAIKISERLVLNYFTAKRLWGAIGLSLQRHEQTFGVLEVDVNKRVVTAGQRPAAR
jgi:hypothetical protein